MNNTGRQDNSALMLRARSELIQAAETLSGATAELGDPFNAAGLRLLIPRLRQGLVRVAVIGATSSGKSTLINALLGDLVVPENPNVSSPIPVWIGYGEGEPHVSIYRVLEDAPGQTDIEDISIPQFQVEYCYNAEHVKKRELDQFGRVQYGAVSVDSPCLSEGMVLIDTLGISATDIDTAKTRSVLEEGVDLVLFVTKNASFTQAERDFLRTCVLGKGKWQTAHPVAPRNILFAVNPFGLKPQPVKAAVEGSIREALAPCALSDEALAAILRDNVFYVHALKGRYGACGPYPYVERAPAGASEKERWALGKKQEEEQKYLGGRDGEELLDESGIALLREGLRAHVLRQSRGVDCAAIRRVRELAGIAAKVQLAAANRLSAASGLSTALENTRAECAKQLAGIDKEKKQISDVLNRYKQDYIASLSQVYAAAQTEIANECRGKVDGMAMPDALKVKWGAFRQMSQMEKQQHILHLLPPLKDMIQQVCTDTVLSKLSVNAPGEVLNEAKKSVRNACQWMNARVRRLEECGAQVIGLSLPTEETLELLYTQMNNDLDEGAAQAIKESVVDAGHQFQKELDRYIKNIQWGWLGVFDFLPHTQRAFWDKIKKQVLAPLQDNLLSAVAAAADSQGGTQSRLAQKVSKAFDDVRDKLRDNQTQLTTLVDVRVKELEGQLAAQTRQTEGELTRYQALKARCQEQIDLLNNWTDVFTGERGA